MLSRTSNTSPDLGVHIAIIASVLAFTQLPAQGVKPAGTFSTPASADQATAADALKPGNSIVIIPKAALLLDEGHERSPEDSLDSAISSGTITPTEVSVRSQVRTAIPETSTALLDGLGILCLLRRRRS